MPINYLDNSANMGAIDSMGSTTRSLIYAMPQLRAQADRMRQQLALQKATEILRGAQTRETDARAGLYKEQETEAKLKGAKTQDEIDKSKHIQKGANFIQAATAMRDLAQSGAPMDNPMASQAALEAMNAGALPQEGVTMDREGMVRTLGALINSRMMGTAAQTPATAQRMEEMHNVPPGNIQGNALGRQGVVGQPRPLVVPQGATAFPQGGVANEQPIYGMEKLPQGNDLVFPGSMQPTIQGQPKPEAKPHSLSSALAGIAMREELKKARTPQDRERIIMKYGAVPQQSAQPSAPPPHMRQVGDQVTTAKGKFQWNGQGWDPVAP
jgi:hypothetical protein